MLKQWPWADEKAGDGVAGFGHAVHGRTYRTRTQERLERTLE
jgi:hypothetical protein